MNSPTIFQYITEEENRFQNEEIQVGDNWFWNFRNHVQLIFHLKNGVFFTGDNEWTTLQRAFKNIMEPILNLSYWSEDIELKDVVFYTEEENTRAASFLIKKFHDEVYVREHNLDTLFDEITESDLDFGGVLVQKTNEPKPEVFQLNTVAFCDQTDMFGGPMAFKHHFAPDKLRKMSKFGWGDEKNGATTTIEELITLADENKAPDGMLNTKRNRTTGKTIEVYVVRGNLPEAYLEDDENFDDYYNQVQIVAFYTDKRNKRNGVVLYRKKEDEGNFKFFTSKKVHGRALGRGVGEALLHPQIWTNFLTIHKTNMQAAGSKIALYTDDETYANKNKIQDMDNLELTTVTQGRRIMVVPTVSPGNVNLFENGVNEWYEQAKAAGSSYDPLMGKESVSGTTFRGQNQLVQQGKGIHDRRRGQRAKFIEEIYRDWIIPRMAKEIVKGKKFLATLSLDELQYVGDCLVKNEVEKMKKEYVLTNLGMAPDPAMEQMYEMEVRKQFESKGDKHFIEILKDEFKDIEIKMGINVAGKQKDLAGLADKILSIFQYIGSNPQGFLQTMQIPGMGKALNDILEFSGISPVDFASFSKSYGQAMQAPQPTDQTAQPAMQPAQPMLNAV